MERSPDEQEQIQRREERLSKLRELALVVTADIVDEHLRSEELFLYSGVIANIELGIQAVEQNDIAEEDHRWWGNLVRDVARKSKGFGKGL